MIPEALAGKRIAVTGATGFLGTALVERLLRSVPECQVLAVVRPGRRGDASGRVARDVLRNDCFDRLRREWGTDFDSTISRRLIALAGDVSVDGVGLDEESRRALAEADVVIHSAATVSFDAPLDAAVEVNLLGPRRVARAMAAGSTPGYLVAVSTAYVAGTRRGNAPESIETDPRYSPELEWRDEVEAARRCRADLEAESRQPPRLAAFHRQARAELGAAGIPLLSSRAEKERNDWVRARLVTAGQARAQMLGWPDVYAYTKALGERALLEVAGEVPLTVVRPSIIESALAEPVPGWIRGFRMAEPIIISYGRGLLTQFPGVPEGVIDVIPVDMVVAAILAAAAAGPDPKPGVYQVASGSINPLRYSRLVDLIQAWFQQNPLYDHQGQPIVVPDWSFPGRGKVQRQLTRAVKGLGMAERAMAALPLRGDRARLSSWLEDRNSEASRALSYVELYGAYAECEAVFEVDRLMGLWDSLADSDRSAFGFDPRAVDWDRYVTDIHLPSVVLHARVRSTPGKRTTPDRTERGRRAVLAPERHLAAFDLENTLVASNVVESYSWLATRHLSDGPRAKLVRQLLAEGPSLLALDRRDRSDFLRFFYRRYQGAPATQVAADSTELLSSLLLARAFPAGLARVRAHRKLGHRTLLITGALDFVVEPLRPLFDDIVAASMTQRNGLLTGELDAVPPTGEARAMVLDDYASAWKLELAESVVYADSSSDLPMMEAVGYPVAVNPETKLAAIARRRGWPVEQWDRAPGYHPPLLPLGPRP